MKRLLLYVHFNKYNLVSSHVHYQLEQMRPLFSKIVFISNSAVSNEDIALMRSKGLFEDFIQRNNSGFDFAAWRDGMSFVGFDELSSFDSVTTMNDTCFGPIWSIENYFDSFEENKTIDFWGLTNNRKTRDFEEHIQSYFMSFKNKVLKSDVFLEFWKSIVDYSDVQDVIKNYETQATTKLIDAGFKYNVIFNTVGEDASQLLHADFSYYHPTAILQHKVPFLKVKAIDNNQHITPYLLDYIKTETNYPIDLIIEHMSDINYPDAKYLLANKYITPGRSADLTKKKIAVHLHVFYVDLLHDFLLAFNNFHFNYDLYITTDSSDKKSQIEQVLLGQNHEASVFVTGNIGRDVLPMLLLKDKLSSYDYIGHFHTKKSKEADFWAGESWRKELIDMLIVPADAILASFEDKKLGIVIADIPTFFRYNKIVNAWNENLIAPEMNDLWKKMNLKKTIDFESFNTFVMSYGTFVWFKYDALKPLFELNLTQSDVPVEPLPQNSILHAIERLLIYIAWDQHFDFRIAKNPVELTPFIENKLLNVRGNGAPNTFVDFTYMGGIKGALKYIIIGPARALKYIMKRLGEKLKK